MSAGMFGVIQVWANNPRGSFVCISSHSGRCSLVVLYGFQTVPHVMYLLHSIQHVHFDLATEAKDQEREAGRGSVVSACRVTFSVV